MKAALNDFVRIANQESLPLCCVFEQKETDITKILTHKHPLLGQFGKHKVRWVSFRVGFFPTMADN